MELQSNAAVYTHIDQSTFDVFGVAILLVIALPLTAFVGYLAGRRHRAGRIALGEDVDSYTGEATLGAILAMLGLLLAFSFGNALSNLRIQENALIDEAAALSTAFARADYLPEPRRTELRAGLLEYAETRIVPTDGSLKSPASATAFLDHTLTVQAKLWPLTVEVTQDPLPPPTQAFIASAVNEVLDAHHYRMQTVGSTLSVYTEAMIFVAAVAAVFLLGNRSGVLGRKLTWRTFFLCGFLIVIMVTISDAQRGSDGLIMTDQSALRITILDMQAVLTKAN